MRESVRGGTRPGTSIVCGVQIRAIGVDELDVVASHLSGRARAQHEARLAEQRAGRYRYLIAWEQVPIGHVGLALPSDRHPTDLCEWGSLGVVEDLWVQGPARRRGAGRELMLALESEARAAGLAEVGLDTGLDDGYAAARRLYRELGYERRTGPYVVSARLPPGHPTLRYWMDIVTAWSKRLASAQTVG
jgi:GNAT superfamily N-acetyltransferase